MKKIVNGIRYNTESSRKIEDLSGGKYSLHYWEATIYKFPFSNNYFIAGRGGPLSRFAQSNGRNTFEDGKDIIPVSKENVDNIIKYYKK
jgi:hypothetical protein